MYNAFSEDYDRFVNWKSRLGYEMPFILQVVERGHVGAEMPRVLDSACGTGMHAIELAKSGYPVFGADLFAEMIDRARRNAIEARQKVRFETAGFGKLTDVFGEGSMDVLLCLGNSLAHVEDASALRTALQDFASTLRSGGVLLLQNRNFDKVMQQRQRWMEPQSHKEGDKEWIFLRFYDFDPDGHIQFHILTLYREGTEGWLQTLRSTSLWPLLQAALNQTLHDAGFKVEQTLGSMDGSPYVPESSDNLIIVAFKK